MEAATPRRERYPALDPHAPNSGGNAKSDIWWPQDLARLIRPRQPPNGVEMDPSSARGCAGGARHPTPPTPPPAWPRRSGRRPVCGRCAARTRRGRAPRGRCARRDAAARELRRRARPRARPDRAYERLPLGACTRPRSPARRSPGLPRTPGARVRVRAVAVRVGGAVRLLLLPLREALVHGALMAADAIALALEVAARERGRRLGRDRADAVRGGRLRGDGA